MAKVIRVLDSWPLLAYFEDQASASAAIRIFEEASNDHKMLISAINWGEILYLMERRYGLQKRDQVEVIMDQMPLEVIPVETNIAREAARMKVQFKIGYADCFAAALAFLKEAELVTGDKDFRVLKDEIRIHWL